MSLLAKLGCHGHEGLSVYLVALGFAAPARRDSRREEGLSLSLGASCRSVAGKLHSRCIRSTGGLRRRGILGNAEMKKPSRWRALVVLRVW